MLELPVVCLDPDLPLPTYAREGDAGLDLLARQDIDLAAAGGRFVMPTGLSIALPPGYAGFIQPRSGLAAKHGVTVLNSPGLIDAGYRGELKVPLVNLDPTTPYTIHRGDRIAQLVVQRVETCKLLVTESFAGEHRGGGFGHVSTVASFLSRKYCSDTLFSCSQRVQRLCIQGLLNREQNGDYPFHRGRRSYSWAGAPSDRACR
jgi:dUTP pyrophosphatase